MATSETRRQLLAAVAACEDKKGEDTRILELDAADSGLADFFVITSATNDRQVLAISDEIEMRLKKDFALYPASVEGRRQAEWILLDYIDIVIHVFLAEKRAFYDIERLRKSARNLTAAEVESELKSALAERTRQSRAAVKTVPAAKSPGTKKKSSPSVNQPTHQGEQPMALKKAVKKAAPKSAKAAKKPAKVALVRKTRAEAPKPAKKAALKKAAKAASKPAPQSVVKGDGKPPAKAAAKVSAKKLPGKTKPATTTLKRSKSQSAEIKAKSPAVKFTGSVIKRASKATSVPGSLPDVAAFEAPPPPQASPIEPAASPVESFSPLQGAKPPVIR
jgi:ribosome-associated protein